MALEREVQTYQCHLPGLLKHEGQYVVVQGETVAGIWPTFDQALEHGYDCFGLHEAFMVRKIERNPQPKYFSRNLQSCPTSTAPSDPPAPSQLS
jgi:hypothetical protein